MQEENSSTIATPDAAWVLPHEVTARNWVVCARTAAEPSESFGFSEAGFDVAALPSGCHDRNVRAVGFRGCGMGRRFRGPDDPNPWARMGFKWDRKGFKWDRRFY
jgi:hypothetical protein